MYKKLGLIAFAILFTMGIFSNKAVAAENLDDLYVLIGDAIMKTKEANWDVVQDNLEQFSQQWNEVKAVDSKKTAEVDKQLKNAKNALAQSEKDATKISENLSALSKALTSYEEEQNPTDPQKEKEKLKQMYQFIDEIEKMIQNNNFDQAAMKYQQLLSTWTANENIVRTESIVSYGEIETQLALLRISLTQTPPDREKALKSLKDLTASVENFLSGKNAGKSAGNEYTLSDVTDLLEKSVQSLKDHNPSEASEHLNKILLIWPVVEGEVRTKDYSLYNRMETEIPSAISLLQSDNKNVEKAQTMISELYDSLQLIAAKTSYTYIDAMLILLREGFEALLIIAGLLSFLKKTNHADKQGWIWIGVLCGIISSAILAVVMNMFFSKITVAGSRESIEGIVGITAVVMMLTVGAWLHKKSNIAHWNQYIKEHLGHALAKGSLFSMALLSFLSIFREGAETIIFYAGMAPSMEISQLILGIAIAMAILVILGFIIIRFSSAIPVRPFFMGATLLIYVLSFKMLGISIHAMQIANTLPTHSLPNVPYIEPIGFYPTIETVVPQLLLILIIIGVTMYVKKTAVNEKAVVEK
ncbi:Fe 2+/Pb2+ permease [Aeribacillus pallidus]|nr:Fe 2+/Pb2+ permease [Aeribacillus pallidus]